MTRPPVPPSDPRRGQAPQAPHPGTVLPPAAPTGVTRDPRVRSPYLPGQEPIPPRRPRRSSPILAPLLAFAGLVLVAGASLWAMGFLDATIGEADGADPTPAPRTATSGEVDGAAASATPGAVDVTPEPVVEITAPPIVEPPSDERANVRGTILFTRSGDIWAASGTTLTRLTSSSSTRSDSHPVWAPDGKQVYFVRTSKRTTDKTRPGGKYTLYPTDLMRMKPDGSGRKKVFDSVISDSRGLWFSHVIQPSVSPNGRDVAVVSDGPDGAAEEVTLHLIDSKNGRLRKVSTATDARLGHNDPAFSPDGTKIAFTYNQASGNDGLPKIAVHSCQSRSNCSLGRVKYLKPGYANPSWSPDGRLLAAESTSGTGRNIVLLNARRGDVLFELTTDGNSFAPEFSPAGDQIAYLRRDGLRIDLRIMTFDIDEQGRFSMVDDRPVTSDGGIDGISTPSWFISPDELDADGETPDEAAASEEPDATAADGAAPPPPGT